MPLPLCQTPILPQKPRPIVVLAAGGIVRDAHLPAYRLAGFEVAGIYDIDREKAEKLALDFGIETVYGSLEEACAQDPETVVFDVAVPAVGLKKVVAALPDGATALLQKPFGENLEEARELLALCRRKRLKAAVNFQLRYAPYIMAARDLIEKGVIGELHDLAVRVTVYMPWHLWTFLEGIPRVEILYHSVHYVDLVRSFFGEPRGVYAKTVKHPDTKKLASTRTNIALDYGQLKRANISANHGHNFGLKHQQSYVKWEGTKGAIKATLGLLMNYPDGEPDALEYCTLDEDGKPGEWQSVELQGSWYPHAFIGTMASLMRFADGETEELPTSVEDAFKTMAVVEASYISNASGGTPIPE
ncbi:Gfo/Idh/MocA family oxidoreductase [Pelagicoccus sp. SDUM812005]|uniref:Gfo/Idh/MocA family protein n=1 Tax=Pelagicoccus sp. SDUM812005 TaxID=3041257 RepID=UPI00280CF1F6|nr:Gfo/Idh/MocA family oxidoreductase [Pelagicoccus sp. SDUM812005]MDQ8179384.1 Gfo/Idh/MocA family oxidoreductase [Pelagicoccus sp. SDUM812005]